MKGFALFILCATALGIAAPVNNIGALKVVGNQIMGADGQPAHLMGMSFYHGQHKAGRDFVKRSVVKSLAEDWRSSVVRIPMMYSSEMGNNGGKGYDQDPQNSVKMVDSVVQAAIDVGIYVLVDWHEVNTIGHQNEAVAFFTDISKRWGSYPNVIYEVFNEPTTSSWEQIKTYATAVIQAIRQNDPDNLIVVGTREWSQQVVEAAKSPLKDQNGQLMSNVAYTLHFYASDEKHQGLRARADSAMALGIALFATEWGNSNSSGGGSLNQSYMDTFMNWMMEKKLCWCNWSLSDIPESSAALRNGTWNTDGLITHAIKSTDGDWEDGDLSQSGLYVRNKIIANSPAYTNLKNVSMHNVSAFPRHTVSVTFNGHGLRLNLGTSSKWTMAELVDIKGAVLASTRLNPGVYTATFKSCVNAQGLSILHLKDIQGNSHTLKIGMVR